MLKNSFCSKCISLSGYHFMCKIQMLYSKYSQSYKVSKKSIPIAVYANSIRFCALLGNLKNGGYNIMTLGDILLLITTTRWPV